jgi:molybdate transport repressor ModE-like protein
MLDFRRLRVLHAVAQYGSVTAAARALRYSGSAVSQQLAALEREVGLAIVEKSGRGVRLTTAARMLVAHTDALLSQLAAAEADIAAMRGAIAGQVRVAAFASAAHSLIPTVWAGLRETAPHVELDFAELEPEQSIPLLLRGELDIAVVHEYDTLPRPLDPVLERRDLLAEPVLVAVPAAHPRAGEGRVDLRDLADEPFLAPRSTTGCGENTLRVCAAAGFVPRVVARADDFGVLLKLVAAGIGVCLVPRLAAERPPDGVRLLPPVRSITRQIFTVSRRGDDRNPAVRVVSDALVRVAEAV